MNTSSKIICSFDVGITNLAYCIMKKENDDYKILRWNIINTMSDDDMRHLKCYYCQKPPKAFVKLLFDYMDLPAGKLLGFCRKHCEYAYDYETFNIESLDICKEAGDAPCMHKIHGGSSLCGKHGKYKFDKHILCSLHYYAFRNKLVIEHSITPFKASKITKTPIKTIQLNLFKLLEKEPEMLSVDEIIIENQPSLKNPSMKSIASAIFNYFTIRSFIDNKGSIKNVQFISPSNKLKIDKDSATLLAQASVNKKYKLTKELSIKYCLKLLKQQPEWIEFLDKFKKKDDLCDSFLQGVYYLNK